MNNLWKYDKDKPGYKECDHGTKKYNWGIKCIMKVGQNLIMN